MPLPLWKYVKNATDEPQVITDLRFVANGGIVSCVPGGLTASVGPRLTVLPGQTVKLPINIYCETARKLAWAEDVSEDAWTEALLSEDVPTPPPPPEPNVEAEPKRKKRGT